MGNSLVEPSCERHVRPLLRLPDELVVPAWQKVVETASGKPITTKLVKDTVAKVAPPLAVVPRRKPPTNVPVAGVREALALTKGAAVSLRDDNNAELALEKLGEAERILEDLVGHAEAVVTPLPPAAPETEEAA